MDARAGERYPDGVARLPLTGDPMMKIVPAAPLLAIWVLLFASSSIPIAAQLTAVPGDRIRVTPESGKAQKGDLLQVDDRHLVVVGSDGAQRLIPVSEIRRVDVRTGRERRFLKTLGITVGISAAGLAAAEAIAWSPCDTCWYGPESRASAFVLGGVAGAVIGLPVGALLGLRRYDRWEESLIPGTTSAATTIRIDPVGGGRVELYGSLRLGGGQR
jgi:hypothetical protein